MSSVPFLSLRIDCIWITRLVCRSFRLYADWKTVRRHGLLRHSAMTTTGCSLLGSHPQTQGASIEFKIWNDTLTLLPVASTGQSITETSAQDLSSGLFVLPFKSSGSPSVLVVFSSISHAIRHIGHFGHFEFLLWSSRYNRRGGLVVDSVVSAEN